MYITKHTAYFILNSYLVSHIKRTTRSLKVCREYYAEKDFGHKKSNKQARGENYLTSSFRNSTPHPILFG